MAIRNYVGARYVPKFADPVEWQANTSYEAMVIVTYNNSSYTSKIPVPPTVGNPAENSTYWALTGNYNAQVEEYRKATANVQEDIDELKTKTATNTNDINKLKPKTETNTNDINELKTKTATNTNDINELKPKTETNTNDVNILRKRLDNLILSSGSDSSAEVIDARTGYDGTTYKTLGIAIRTQVNDINKDLIDSNLVHDFKEKITATTDKWDESISFRHIWLPFKAKANFNIKSISFNCLVNDAYKDNSNDFHCELLQNDGKTIIASATTNYEWVNNTTFVNFSFDLNGTVHKDGNYYLYIYCLTRSFSYAKTGYMNVYEDDYILSSPPARFGQNRDTIFEQSGTNDMIRLSVSMLISGKNITDISEIKSDVVNVKSDIPEIKSDIVNVKSDISEIKSDIVNVKSDISEIKNIEPIKLYVSKSGSDITGDGSKEKPYASIFHANESITDSSSEKPYKIIVAKGTYTDLQEKYAGDTTTGSYKGVIVKDHVYIESEDVKHPELTILEWDGFTGFTNKTYTEKIRSDMCLFHFTGRKASRKWASSLKGFTLRGSNTRYLLHIEANSDQNLEIENCIFDWNGTPKGQYHNIPVVGCGGSFNQNVTFKNCIFKNSESTAGVQWHDNVYPYSDLNIYHGANFNFMGCKFDELDIQMRSTNPNRDMPFSLIIEKCGGIRKAVFSKSGSATKNYWRGHVIASFIDDDKISNANDETNEATPFELK